MIRLNSDLKQEHVRFIFLNFIDEDDDKTWADLDENKYSDYLKKMENILSKSGYDMNTVDANIRINGSRGSNEEFIYLEIQASGLSEHGEYRSFNMESENGKPFSIIYVYNKDFDEIETLEI